MYSFTFDSTYLEDLTIEKKRLPTNLLADSIQLPMKSYASDSKYSPKNLTLDIAVTGSGIETKLDTIKKTLNQTRNRQLILDSLPDRYWMARFLGIDGDYVGPRLYRATLIFSCFDPIAYGVTQIENAYTIDGISKTIVETPGGTAIIYPVYSINVQDTYTDITIRNECNGDELVWTGTIASGETLEVDCELWKVSINGTASMTISGTFPRLLPDEDNAIKVTGAWDVANPDSTLTITYRNRFL